ncbi:MAG: DHA2 family efflux MFS transporter permease subunit [Sporomusaceae bacterium]|nr:DHA2 family efflux MFS transporter permease subunit [Sporomusaceae bacterium]
MNKYAVLCTVCLGTVLTAYVSSCVNIALPNIMAALNFNMDSIVWVSLSYMLPYGSTLPLTGKLGDRFGAKRIYLFGIVLFTAASLLCGIAASKSMMICFRILQGIGAGMVLPNAMTIVAETFPVAERGAALGIWSAMAAAGSAMGPTLGGLLLEKFDWRSVFFSVEPACILSLILGLVVIPASQQRKGASVDYIGAGFMIASISCLLVALNQGQKEGWDSLYISTLFYAAFATLVLFIVVELRVEKPMIQVELFRDINFVAANIVGFVTFVTLYGGMFLLPFFLKSILNYNSITAGIVLLPLTATMVVFSPLGGRLADRLGSKIPAFIGVMLVAFSLYWLDSINENFATNDFFVRLMVFGVGLGLTMSPLSNCAVSSLPRDKIGVGAGIFNLSKIIGGSMGVVFAETLLTRREIYHTAVLKEYLNAAVSAPQDIFRILQVLWGNQGMTSGEIAKATHGWMTGSGLLPQQYTLLKAMLSQMVTRQASILSFQDVFFTMALLCFVGGFFTLLIRPKN